MDQDVIVIGGSYAGMAAALQLLRARRKVTVIDAGLRRNRFASHSHGFLGQDGVDPGEIAASARRQLEAYPSLTWIDGEAISVAGEKDNFTVTADTSPSPLQARRILFATGVRDQLPPVEGLQERWGRSVFHCPYCHGYELEEGEIGVIASGPNSVHQAQLLPEWGPTTFFLDGRLSLEPEARYDLQSRGVRIIETPIRRIEQRALVRLEDGRALTFAGLFTASLVEPASDLAQKLGCAIDSSPMGRQIRSDTAKETTVPGVYACGDVAKLPHSVSLAVGDGAWAGAQLHRSLVWP